MLEIPSPSAARDWIGKELPPSSWVTIDQAMIDAFAAATGDHQWIHVDPVRAETDLPGGKTIAHGFLTLSLVPRLQPEVYGIGNVAHILNYGCDRLRFLSPVPAGARVRLKLVIKEVEEKDGGGIRIVQTATFEIEGEERPALIADTIRLIYPAVG